jgi:glutamate/tyrosine decarboxylase-like PLP-dependent enzyme
MNDSKDLAPDGPGDPGSAAGKSAASLSVPEGPTLGLSPQAFQDLGERLLAALADYKRKIPTRQVRPQPPVELTRQIFAQALPETGAEPKVLVDWMTDNLLPSSFGNDHPAFFAWITAPSAPIGALAELMAATVNTPAGGPAPAAVNLEACVTRWLMELCGFPVDGSQGILVSGGSMANLTALAVARHWAAKADGWNIRTEGLQGARARYTLYATKEAHSCVRKSVEVLGLGTDNLREVPVDGARRLSAEGLAKAVAADRAAGLRPFCVVASAGTVNTGAVDPLNEIADVCEAEGLWLHVDGAYGWIGGVDPAKAPLYEGLARAHSLALDPHKWLAVPIECGCTLVRDRELQRETFSYIAPYLRIDGKAPDDVPYWPAEYGIQLTRGFRALKVWATLSQLGRRGVRDLVVRHNALARRLAGAVEAAADLELTAPVTLSIVCFRYRAPGWQGSEQDLDALNQRINDAINDDGRFYFTPTSLDGRYSLRACIIHYDTGPEEVDGLVAAVREAGARLAATG